MTVMHPGDKHSSTVCRSHRRLLGAGFSVCLIWNDPCLQSLSVVLYAAYLAELNQAEMASVISYLRASPRLRLPASWPEVW